MLGSETWIVLGAGAISAAIAAVIAWLIRKREREPEDVTIGFLGPSLAASTPSSPPPRVSPASPPSWVSPASLPSWQAPGVSPSPVRLHQAAGPSPAPQPRPSRPPSASAFLPRSASELIGPPPPLPARGLPQGLLITLIMAPCVAAAVTRFARGR